MTSRALSSVASAIDTVGGGTGSIGASVRDAAAPRSLARLAKVLAVLTFIVASWGGAVTSTDSGLADEHWPSFEGSWLPSLDAMMADSGKFLEHGHRIVAGTAVLLTWVLAFLLRSREQRAWVRRVAFGSGVLGLVLAGFGGLTVLLKLPPAVSIIHVSLAMLFLSLNVTLAVALGQGWRAADAELEDLGERKAKAGDILWLGTAGIWTAVVVYTQIVLGAIPRHADKGVFIHILWAFAVFTVVLLVTTRVFGRHGRLKRLVRPSVGLLLLVLVQFLLGISTFVTRPKALDLAATPFHELMASVHQASGVLMLALSVCFMWRALRFRSVARDRPELVDAVADSPGGVA